MTEDRLLGGFDADTFRARRERIFGALEGGAMVLPSAPVLRRAGDTEQRYRPDSEVLYVTGFEEPDTVVVLRGHADSRRFVLFAPERDPESEVWTGRRLGPEAAAEAVGADEAHPVAELGQRLPGLLHGATAVHYRLGADARVDASLVEALEWSRRKGARLGSGPRSVIDPGEILSEMRLRKEPGEVACIRRAADLTVDGFRRLASAVAPGVGEWELEALIDSRFRAGGAEGPGFPTIVGAGVNARVLHYVSNRSRLQAGELVLVDAGAEVEYYSADVTRTFPVSGRFTSPQKAVYEIVREAHARAVEAARPGAPVGGLHAAAVGTIGEGLRELGILTASVDEILERELYKPYYPHQTSHWLGLNVHDPGDYRTEGSERLLEPGMVLTVEPGLYVDARADGPHSDLGVRLEDDVLITADGPEILTASLPLDAAQVEAMVGAERARP